ncbi:MAG TPA: response regulator [Chthoniobacterales bacterium]|jgi:CheY-like chemotaxis protein
MSEDNRWLKTTVNDLNNLLQEISGYVHLARESSNTRVEADEHLQSCVSSIERASEAVKSVLAHLGSDEVPEKAFPPISLAVKKPEDTASLGFKGLKSQAVEMIGDITVTNPAGKKETILVVDDEVHVMLLAKMMLAENGYKVVTAKDGFEAMEIYKKLGNKIDLIILDFTMPGMHGDQVFEELRKINPSVAVILSSGFADQTKLNRMFAQGLKEFIAKPYTQQRLLSEIRNVLDSV